MSQNFPYNDILHLDRPASTRKPMLREKRAAQFMPFAALKGYDEAVIETARITHEQPTLAPERITKINDSLAQLLVQKDLLITLSYFINDQKKTGGHIKTLSSCNYRLDEFNKLLIIDKTISIPFENIIDISID